LENVAALYANAENISFPDSTFDFALCGFMGWDYCFDFALGEFTGPDIRMREISRVLKDGGRVGISSWVKQDDLDWMEEAIIRHFPAILSDHEFSQRRPIGYSREGAESYKVILKSAGFVDIEIIDETVEFVSTDEKEWWEQMRQVGWHRFFEKIEHEGADRLQRLKQDVFKDLQHHRRTEGIHFTKSVVFVFGTK
jgi:ubiquinone/menaquinone biosynthesis C-methylase UbiE